MPEAGEVLKGKVVGGKFHLGRYLGGSDRSAVFLTERLQGSPRAAAIKLISADPVDADLQLSRWKLISRLSHPHILQIFEAGRCQQGGEELLYVVMEYAEENLAQILPTRSLTPEETNAMLKPALEALAYLHGRGFAHGHLQPSNIMVVGEQLQLSSDGICRIGERNTAPIGPYRPPDPAGSVVAPPQDVWSLGVTLVQVATRLLPVRNGNGQPGVTLPETLPAEFVELAQNCLEPDAQRRCTLEEIAEHLHFKLPARTMGPPVAAAEPSDSPDAGSQQTSVARPAERAKRTRSPLLAAAVILGLVAMIGGFKLFNRHPAQPDAPAVASEAPTPAEASSQATSEAPPPARTPLPATARRSATSSEHPRLQTASEPRNPSWPVSVQPRERAASQASASGEILQRVLPDVSRGSFNTIRGTVRVTVRARIDQAGDVTAVNFISAGPSQYFSRLAADAARQWKFSPVQRDAQAGARTLDVRFEFTRYGVKAFPVTKP